MICTGHGWQVETAVFVRTLANGLPSLTGLQHSCPLEPRPRSFPDLPYGKNHSSSDDGIVISTNLPHTRAVQPRLTSLGTYYDPLDDCSSCLPLHPHHSFRGTAHGDSDPFAFYTLSPEVAHVIRTSYEWHGRGAFLIVKRETVPAAGRH